MKKLTLFLLLLFTASALSAQSDKPRNWKTVVKFQRDNKDNLIYSNANILRQWDFNNNSFAKPFSLKSLPKSELNNIELYLLNKYPDVAITTMRALYFTIVNENCIGIVSADGQELCSPSEGGIVFLGQTCLIGEQTNAFQKQTKLECYTYGTAYPVGVFRQAIHSSLSSKNTVVIPENKYICSSVTTAKLKPYFYVCQLDGSGNLYWGLLDQKGQEIIECKYKGIIFEKGKFIGTNDMDMQDIVNIYDEIVGIKQVRRQNRDATIAAIAEIGNEIGSAMIEVGSNMQPQQRYTGNSANQSSDSTSSSFGSNSKSSRTSKSNNRSAGGGTHPGMSRSELQQRYNAEIQTIRRLRDSWAEHIGTHGEVVNQNTLRDCKANIQSIKNSAAQHSITIQTDPLENWTPAK